MNGDGAQEFLEGLAFDGLARLCRGVFQDFTIKTSGVAQRRVAAIEAYELTPLAGTWLWPVFLRRHAGVGR